MSKSSFSVSKKSCRIMGKIGKRGTAEDLKVSKTPTDPLVLLVLFCTEYLTFL
jgi:hypothetical protein